MKKKKYTKAQQQKALDRAVKILNDYDLTVSVEHTIRILPIETRESTNEENKEG